MKIISWNVNGVRACFKKGLADFIKKEKPDVFCLQELKAYKEQCDDFRASLVGFNEEWSSAEKAGYSGVGTFSKKAFESSQLGMGVKEVDREGRVIVSEYKKFYLVNTYFPNGAASDERHEFKMRFLDKIVPFLKKLEKKKPVVLLGDINIAHKEIDIHDPVRLDGTSGFMPVEREWMDFLESKGFVDAYRLKYPNKEEQFSWWSYRAGARQRNKGWRIDYFLISQSIADKVDKVKMHQSTMGSDHCPLSLEIELT